MSHEHTHTFVLAARSFSRSSQSSAITKASRFCGNFTGWVQFYGLLTKWDVLFPRWSQAKDTRSVLETGMFPAATLSQNNTWSQRCSDARTNISSLPILFVKSNEVLPWFSQSLLTGLMYYRPDDPIDYLEGCLKKVRELGGTEKVRWDTFVGQEKKSLPPLNGGQSRRSLFRNGERWMQIRHSGAVKVLSKKAKTVFTKWLHVMNGCGTNYLIKVKENI